MRDNDLKVTTTPPEVVEDGIPNEVDRFLAHTSTSNKSFVVHDRTGVRLSFSALLPITTGDNGEQRIWASSIILNCAALEYPQVAFKLRVSVKKRFNPHLTCNKSKGIIKQNDIFLLTYQLPESSIESVQLTLLIDGNPYEVPICKIPKSDYYWLGKETNVPGPMQLLEERRKAVTPKTESTLKNVSPGRMENVPDGLKRFLLGENGFESICKLLFPHSISLFRDLSEMKVSKFDMSEISDNGNYTDMITDEILRRFYDENRRNFTTTPTLLQ